MEGREGTLQRRRGLVLERSECSFGGGCEFAVLARFVLVQVERYERRKCMCIFPFFHAHFFTGFRSRLYVKSVLFRSSL